MAGSLRRALVFASLVLAVGCGRVGFSERGDAGLNIDDAGVMAPFACTLPPIASDAFYVDPVGDDNASGSAATPWKTIGFAANNAPDGATVIVRPGNYADFATARVADPPVTLLAAVPYKSFIESTGSVIQCQGCAGLTIVGFEFTQLPGGANQPLLIFTAAKRIVLRNNVVHDGRANANLRFAGGYADVLVERNLFYNSGTNTMVHFASGSDAIFRDNLLFSDFEAANHIPSDAAFYFVWLEDSDGSGSTDHVVARNIFMRWEDRAESGFIGVSRVERADIYSNLFVGDGSDIMEAPLILTGSSAVRYRNNTIVGDLPGNAYGVSFFGPDAVNGLELANNIWADPTTTMQDFSDGSPSSLGELVLKNNLFWNGGAQIPSDTADPILVTDDARAVLADPRIARPLDVAGPIWQRETGMFVGDYPTVCAAFTAMARRGAIDSTSPAFGAAEPSLAPADDLLGRARATPSIGAIEPPD